MIAVLDGGFFQLDIIPFYDSLRNRNGFIATKDFVEGDSVATEASMHGTQVLSTMAAYMPGVLVGTAPGANYICVKTEDVRGENLIEVCNWVAGLEYADSLGADLVNSSLGYNTFDDKSSSYTYEQMDGISTLSSIAADIAFAKGMIVVTSVGNEGHHKWKYLDSPADAINIIAVGAVDSNNERTYFSSIGPTADGRIKPEISALGLGVQAASVRSLQTTRENGTSLSAPIITGLIACLWQAYPDKSNKEIIEAVLKSASQYDDPDNELGYGIPDFQKALELLKN
jgi:subtilisin family serine protease